MTVDAIVNTANPNPVVGEGTDAAVYNAAGIEKMLAERKQIGKIQPGSAAYTSGFNLPAKYVIHAVTSKWIDGNSDEERIIHESYKSAFKIAEQLKCESIAFPLMASGSYGVPKDIALKVAIDEISDYLLANDMEVYLVVYDSESFEISNKLFNGIVSYIGDNYIRKTIKDKHLSRKTTDEEICKSDAFTVGFNDSVFSLDFPRESGVCASVDEKKYPGVCASISLEDYLRRKTDNFQNTLQSIIASKNLSNAEVYRKSNIDKKLFSKIISNKDYVPKKRNVIAFTIGLELSLEEAENLLKTAGYAFSNSEVSDLIVKYFITNKMYNIFEINSVLFSYKLPLLGNTSE